MSSLSSYILGTWRNTCKRVISIVTSMPALVIEWFLTDVIGVMDSTIPSSNVEHSVWPLRWATSQLRVTNLKPMIPFMRLSGLLTHSAVKILSTMTRSDNYHGCGCGAETKSVWNVNLNAVIDPNHLLCSNWCLISVILWDNLALSSLRSHQCTFAAKNIKFDIQMHRPYYGL